MVAVQKLDGSAGDILNIFDSTGDRRPLGLPIAAAVLCHLLMLLLRLPSVAPGTVVQTPFRIVSLKFSQPAATGARNESAPRPDQSTRKATVEAPVPIPMPVLREPVPIRQWRSIEPTVEDLEASLELSLVQAPPGGKEGDHAAGNELKGAARTLSGAEPVYSRGEASQPQLITSTLPNYTDEAIRSKVRGTVLLEGIVRINGRVDSLRVVRGLGFGLDESAIL